MNAKPFPRTPRLDGPDPEAKRREIRDYFHATSDRYELLFEVLASDEAYYGKPIPLRHPLIFYFGHTATFFVNKLVLAGLLNERIAPRFESMFAIGVDEMSWDDLGETHYDWPAVGEVRAYRRQVRAAVDALIAGLPLVLPIAWEHPWWPILMGIERERSRPDAGKLDLNSGGCDNLIHRRDQAVRGRADGFSRGVKIAGDDPLEAAGNKHHQPEMDGMLLIHRGKGCPDFASAGKSRYGEIRPGFNQIRRLLG